MYTKPARQIALLALSIVAVALGSSCINSNSSWSRAAGKKLFAVGVDAAPFYYHGPRQGAGPDKTLPKDTFVTMIRPSFGYCKVRLTTGEEGYMANDDLHIVASTMIATASTSAPNNATAAHLSPDAANSQFPTSEAAPEFEPTPIPVPPVLND